MNKIFHSNSYKLLAFTLAETLIVIGVIGIVSALTLPNLNSSTGEKEKVAKVKKIYQNITDAFTRAEAVYGPFEEWFVNYAENDYAGKAKRAGERITEFMKVSKTCGVGTGLACFSNDKIKDIRGNAGNDSFDKDPNLYKIITADGTSIAIDWSGVIVDIDGPTKGKFSYGHDIFCFEYPGDKLGFVPVGFEIPFPELAHLLAFGVGEQAAAWILRYDNADYLQIKDVKDDVAICKNGNEMTEANPTCK